MPNRSVLQSLLLATSIATSVVPVGVAYAQTSTISVGPMSLAKALDEIARQAGTKIVYDPDAVPGKTSAPVVNAPDVMSAISAALQGTGLSVAVNPEGVITVSQDIVVTASRDEAELSFRVDGAQSSNRSGKSLKELPQGTQVVTSALIRQQQALTVNDALRNSAGVVDSTGNVQGTPSFRIRGNTAAALQNGVATGGGLAAIDTVERIEILKGPAAILAGANNLGGVVNIVDKRPSAEPILDVLVQYGTFDNKKVVIDASNALNESKTLSARVIGVQAGSERGFGGYRGRREEVIAPSLRYKTDMSDYILGMNATSTRSSFENFRVLDPLDTTRFLDLPGRVGPRGQGFDNDVTRFYGSAEQRVTPWLALVARGSYTRDNLKGRIIAPAFFPDPTTSEIFAFAQSLNNQQRNWSVDTYARINFRTGPAKHTLTAGYNHDRGDFRSFQQPDDINTLISFDILQDSSNLPLPGPAEIPSYRQRTRQSGFYVQDFIDIGRFHLLAGVRRTTFKSQVEVYAFGESNRERSAATTPNFGAVFDVTRAISIYANYQQGFEPTTALNCAGDTLPVPKSENIEAGVKADLFSKRLSATASVYQLKLGNQTIGDFTCPLPDRSRSLGGIQTRGVELDLNGEVLPGLNVSASYTFADNSYQDEELGTVPPLLYRHKYSFYAFYEVQKGGLKGLGIAGGIFGNGRTYVDTFGQISLPPQAQFDGNISYRLGRARLNVGVKNITDKRLNAIASNPTYIPYLQPRTVTATLTYSFYKYSGTMSWKTLWRPQSAGSRLTREERQHRWRHFWRLLGSFWVSNQWKIAWPMFGMLIGLQYASIYTMLMMTNWEKALFDSLDARRASALMPLVFQFFAISMTTVGVSIIQSYVSNMLKMRWRSWLTADYMERWLRHNRFLDIERSGMIDNPDQRIAEDLQLFSDQTLEMVLSVISVVMSVITFGAVLMAASEPISFSLAGLSISIPGDLLIYAVLYAFGGSWLITYVGKPLVKWTIEQQHLSANFRFRLINVRRNAEQIAFARTIASEWRRLTEDFRKVFLNFRGLTIRQQYVTATGGLYGSIGGVLPVFLLMPKYFAGQMTLGTVMQNRSAFSAFNSALSYVVQAYTAIATLIAVIARIRHLDWAIATPTPSGIAMRSDGRAGISVRNLTLATPAADRLVEIRSWTVAAGQRWSIQGPSGAGKSTLLRAVAGIWPYGSGEISVPEDSRTMFVSQRTFLPIGSLKEAMTFPAEPDAFTDEECCAVLQMFRLGGLCDELQVETVWQDRLSPGEQQRLSFARVILQKPDILFLDEATSALDGDNANHAYQALLGTLPGLTLISVVHDPRLADYHDRRLEIVDGTARCEAAEDAIKPSPDI